MAFELPKLVDLTDDQNNILFAPLDKNMIVQGPPGTGKSVLAIYRAADLSKAKRKILLLVYNRPLKMYIEKTIRRQGICAEVASYTGWLYSIYRDHHLDRPEFREEWDYSKVVEDFKEIGQIYDVILIDEAQDLPLNLIKALTYIGKNVECFMDVGQRIQNNERIGNADVARALNINSMYTLEQNFRNTEEILNYAQLYNNSGQDIETMTTGEKPFIKKCASLEEEYGYITDVINANSTRTIGIFTSYNQIEDVWEEIKARTPSQIPIHVYNSNNKEHQKIDFETNGVFILTTGCMKGLEFDVVIIPEFNKLYGRKDPEVNKNTFYVAVTRAAEEVFCFYTEEGTKTGNIDVFGPLVGHEDVVEWEK